MAKTLFIDTSDSKKIIVGLEADGKKSEITSESVNLKSEAALPLVNQLLEKNRLEMEDIEMIKVNTGPGSFTGLRVGASIANALGFLLKIPVNGRKIGELARPVYNESRYD